MAAVCWSLVATRTLLRFDESEEDATRERERERGGGGEKERERRKLAKQGRGESKRTKKRDREKEAARVILRTDEKRDDEDRKQEMNNAWGRRGNTWKGEQGVRAATRRSAAMAKGRGGRVGESRRGPPDLSGRCRYISAALRHFYN